MNNTKNDLSGGLAKLDFAAIRQTAIFAVGGLLEDIHKHHSIIRDNYLETSKLYLHAQWLKDSAAKLAIAAETLGTLNGATERDIKIVNR